VRTLENSEIRPYSWPCILVFVDEWVELSDFKSGKYHPDDMVPKTLYLPDGRKVPVCVVLARKEVKSAIAAPDIVFPLNNIGGGNPVIARVQGREHVATISCLVTDGHRTYALTNRHVVGDPGESLYSCLSGNIEKIGSSSIHQLTRIPFDELYPEWPGKHLYVNLDAGLIDIDDLHCWTAQVHSIGTVGPLADLSVATFSLSLIGCWVVGVGAASGRMEGEIHALLYRYKSIGGFEYLADFLIGPRSESEQSESAKKHKPAATFLTRHGDSGALWMFEPRIDDPTTPPPEYRPFAIQWGEQVYTDVAKQPAQSYVLATSLSTICSLLDIDLVRDWNLDQQNTWGAIGHFSIAASVVNCVTNTRLKSLMSKNAEIISPAKEDIKNSEFKGMGTDEVVPLADVPDMFWKPRIAKQGFARAMEGPNHFADMDQLREDDGKDLLHLTQKDEFIDPDKWNEFYSSVNDILSGDPIEQKHRGLLPFRVWQIFNDMVRFVKAGKAAEFVCAAGVLTHYVGDACQPLHISYLHDGDPEHPETQTTHHRDGTTSSKQVPQGSGVHSAYEDNMVSDNRDLILDGLEDTPKVKAAELITTGFDAAKLTIEMMRGVFKRLPPRKIVQFFIDSDEKPKQLAEDMWKKFGSDTIKCMQDGTHLLAVLWQSAWVVGAGDDTIDDSDLKAITGAKAMSICQHADFIPSVAINKIGAILKKPV